MDKRIYVAPAHFSGPRGDGPLNGKRLVVKDLFAIKGERTGQGNPDLLASAPIESATAPAVLALQKAGADYHARTTTDELAYSLNGTNAHFGTPQNPRAPLRLPGGSSVGSAVAVARGEADIGLGTDTGGSIRVPSSYCGLYGLRPTHGRIEMSGLKPLAPRFDTVGFMTRDLATLTQVSEVLMPPTSATRLPARIILLVPEGLAAGPYQRLLGSLARRLESLGFRCERRMLSQAFMAHASEAFRILQGCEIRRTHQAWLSTPEYGPESRWPRLNPDIAARLKWCMTLSDTDEQAAETKADSVRRWYRQQLVASQQGDEMPCDESSAASHGHAEATSEAVFVLPTTPGASPLLGASLEVMEGYRYRLMGLTALAGLNGAPQLSLPWMVDGAARLPEEAAPPPWGVSLLGLPGRDESLLALARLLEG
ncbi:amidase family protein [Cobetia sp. L2A1]|uniref:amidase family protein n=1 Tax=Cobetia sp. L2A1 TaxID=2686360 RepID=UPI00131CE66F|nr:amidase family protein [Cobetia sp. L2A1]